MDMHQRVQVMVTSFLCLLVFFIGQAVCAQQFNVVTYGADPTGKNDSTQAIMAAAAAAKNGGTVYFPAGTFLYNQAIWLPQNVSIAGASVQNTIVQPTNSQGCAFVLSGNCSVSNITFDPKQVGKPPLNSPAQESMDMYPTSRDIFVNGAVNATSINIGNVNASSITCFTSSVSVINNPNLQINGVFMYGCNPIIVKGGGSYNGIYMAKYSGKTKNNTPCANVSISEASFLPATFLPENGPEISAADVDTLTIEKDIFSDGFVTIIRGSVCYFEQNTFKNSGLVANGVTGQGQMQKSALFIGSNKFILQAAQKNEACNGIFIGGNEIPSGEGSNGKILISDNAINGTLLVLGNNGVWGALAAPYTNNSNIINNQFSNGASIYMPRSGCAGSSIFGNSINIQGNMFSGSYNNYGGNAWLISILSAPNAQDQQLDPLTVNIIDNQCNIQPPALKTNATLNFIWCCTPDPTTQVNIEGNRLGSGLFLQTAQGTNLKSMPPNSYY